MGHLADAEYVLDAARDYHAAAQRAARASAGEGRALNASPARLQRLRDASATAVEAAESAAHELHVRMVEIGQAMPDPQRYGTFTRRWFGNEISYTRRAPRAGGQP